ncbi:MAG: hypothetical protein AB7O04_07565 [Hyphomonadaceae bacterium]
MARTIEAERFAVKVNAISRNGGAALRGGLWLARLSPMAEGGKNRRWAGLAARACAALAALVLAVGAAGVFEAASDAEIAGELAHTALESNDQNVKAQRLADAQAITHASWSGAEFWHVGVIEAQSWIYALQAEAANQDVSLMQLSAISAARGVSLAPIQPTAWARLAAFAEIGRVTPQCDTAECLERSWRAAAMTSRYTACARLQIAHRQDLLRENDERLIWFLSSGVHERIVARCLYFMTPEDIYHALMARERAEQAAR